MSDDLRRFLDDQEAFKAKLADLGDLSRKIKPLEDVLKRTAILDTRLDFFNKHTEEQRKWLSTVTNAASSFRNMERQFEMLARPVSELHRADLFREHSNFRKSIDTMIGAQAAYEHLFRLPDISEVRLITKDIMQTAGLAQTVLQDTERLQAAMAKMHAPWLRVEEKLASAKAFSNIIAMGRGVQNFPAFDHRFSAALRSSLGDWRDPVTPAVEQLLDSDRRSDFYVKQGFDRHLTDFTCYAFNESLRIAGLDELAPTQTVDNRDNDLNRSNQAFDRLLRFELELRRFIVRVMTDAYGPDWMLHQLPSNMLEKWEEKRDQATKAGQAEHPLIDYADFTDYKAIIERKDNWSAVFKVFFLRPDDIRESFQRLFPVRIATMHARLISQDDELLLLVETRRVLKAIKSD